MGRYISKKQNIQESNIKLEQRFLNERSSWANMRLFKDTEDLDELGMQDHYVERKFNRVHQIIRIEVPKESLGDFTIEDVKIPLLEAVKKELNAKLDSIESMSKMALSETYKVGYKIFEPILIGMNRKKYPIKIVAPPTPEKEKQGVTKEQIGTYYYVIIDQNILKTIILSDAEDFESAVKRHEELIGSDKPVRILNVPATKEFELAKIMGVKQESNAKLIDPNDLEYQVRGDYRTKDGGKFFHKEYGKGVIQNTSNGRVGEPDTRGMLDWVDVKFPSKGNRVIRFNKVYAKKFFELQDRLGVGFKQN